jgi:hypothetical protein
MSAAVGTGQVRASVVGPRTGQLGPGKPAGPSQQRDAGRAEVVEVEPVRDIR